MADYITTREYADLHGIKLETVRTRVKNNRIPHIKVGDSIMIDRNTPWETRYRGRPRVESRESTKENKTYEVKIVRAYYIAVEDSSGKEVVSDFTFLPMDEAVKIGERMKTEVEYNHG